MASQLYNYTPTELQKLLDESAGYSDVLRKLKMNDHGGNPRTLKKVIAEYNLDETKLNENRHKLFSRCSEYANKKNIKYSLEDILAGKHPGYQSSKLLERLIEEGYKEMKCECCGIIEWMGKPISFHLHHKDGDHNNNDIENLEILCPNCHSQTDNFAGKNVQKKKIHKKQKKKEKSNKEPAKRGISEDGQRFYNGRGNYKVLCPICNNNFMKKEAKMCRQCYDKERLKPKVSKEELIKIMETNSYCSAAELLGVDRETISRWHKYYTEKERENGDMIIGSDKAPSRDVLKTKIRTMSFVQIGKEYGVTDNSVRRWCDTYKLPRLVSEIRSISDEEWEKF